MVKSMNSRYYESAVKTSLKSNDSQRNELICKYAPMVKYLVGRFALRLPPHISKDEVKSAGMIGLFKALDSFDPEMGFKFETYAAYRIKGAILDEMRKMDWVSRSVRRDIHKIENAIWSLQGKLNREPDDEEIAHELKIDLDSYYKILQKSQGVRLISLDEIKSINTSPILDSLISNQSSALDEVNKKELKSVITRALSDLSEKEQMIMNLYYYEELTLKEIASIMELTESRISQIHTKVIIVLRTKLKRYFES